MPEENQLSPKNRRAVVVTFLLLLCIGCGILFYIFSQNEDNKKQQALNTGIALRFVSNETQQVEYGSKIDPMDFVQDYKGDLKKPTLDTTVLGLHQLKYTISVEGYEKDFYKNIMVVDSQMPEIYVNKGTEFEVEKGELFHLDVKDVKATDPVDGRCETKIEGEVNTNVTGLYLLRVSAWDANGNRSDQRVSVRVLARPKQKASDLSIGRAVDDFSVLSNGDLLVRQKSVEIVDSPKEGVAEEYAMQINTTPQYLLDAIDHIQLESQKRMEKDLDVTNTDKEIVIGHTRTVEGESTIYLNGDALPEKDTIIHECAHAYGYKMGILNDKEFNQLYQAESGNMEVKAAQENINEFFAYSYTTYIREGYQALAARCPQTAQYYADTQV